MTNNNPHEIEDVPCEQFPNFRRNNYFFGKLLTASDFKTEQKYLVDKQRLINRLVHGVGIMCGLKVLRKGPKAKDLHENQIRITEGVAIDACGREIVLSHSEDIDISEYVTNKEETQHLYVWVKYDFCGEEKVPNVPEATDTQNDYFYNKIKEGYRFEFGNRPPRESENERDICKRDDGFAENHEKTECLLKKCPELFEDEALVLAKITLKQKEGTFFVSKVDNLARNEDDVHRKIVYSNAHLFNMMACLRKRINKLENLVESSRKERKLPLGKRIRNWLKSLEF